MRTSYVPPEGGFLRGSVFRLANPKSLFTAPCGRVLQRLEKGTCVVNISHPFITNYDDDPEDWEFGMTVMTPDGVVGEIFCTNRRRDFLFEVVE